MSPSERAAEPAKWTTGTRTRLAGLLLAILCAAVAFLLPGTIPSLVATLVLVLAVPGFVWAPLLFPAESLRPEAQLGLALVLSLVFSILWGVVLVLSPLGLTELTYPWGLVGIVAAGAAAGWAWKREEKPARFEWRMGWREMRAELRRDPVLGVFFVLAILVIAGSAAVILTAEYPTRTRLYLLAEDGTISLPDTAQVGVPVTVRVGVTNGEGDAAQFDLVGTFGGGQIFSQSVQLADNETQEWPVTFTPATSGRQLLQFNLTVNAEFYGDVHTWIDVAP